MEWYKIKNILIAALILTNLLLIFIIIFDSDSTKNSDNELLSDTIYLLEKNGISIKDNVQFPKIEDKMSVLTLSYDSKNGKYFFVDDEKISKAESISSKKAIEIAENALNSLNIEMKINNTLKQESINKIENSSSYEVMYCNYYNNLKIEDSYIIFQVSSNGVEIIKRNLAYAESSGKSKQKIIPITTSLLKYMNQISSDSYIKQHEISDISMIYKVNSPYNGNATTDTAFPFWRITSNDTTTDISAFN